ncbi:MAG: sensor histidine kinase, partial [Thermoleophilia bacterium]
AGLAPMDFFTSPREIDNFALYYFWGFGFVGFSAVLARVSALELESILSEERSSYRRRLHDDLGNTLCGLHFKIQSLRKPGSSSDVKRSLSFLSAGYDRAVSVLKRILSGLDEQAGGDINSALTSFRNAFESETGMQVDLRLATGKTQLSPEVQRQVLGIVREAAANAFKHAGAGRVTIEACERGRRMSISVTDRGTGFSDEELAARQADGGLGVKSMQERARLIRGKLEIAASPGGGTRVELVTDAQRPGLIGRVLDYDRDKRGSGLYIFLIRLRTATFVWTFIRLFMLMGDHLFDAPLILVVTLLGVDTLAFVLFRSQLYRLLSRRPWLLLFEAAMFAVLVYISLQAEAFFFFPLYVGVVVIMNGLFLDTLGNIVLTLFLNTGIFLAYLLAPAASEPVVRGLRLEEPLQHTTIFVILAFSAGMAGEFIRSLEFLQQQAIDRALTREREILSAETHRQLYDGVFGLGEEIRAMQSAGPSAAGTIEAGSVEHLKYSSSELKKRLRTILASLEDDTSEHQERTWATNR